MVQVDIIPADALTPQDVALWRAMVGANPDLNSPYFRPEFTQVAADPKIRKQHQKSIDEVIALVRSYLK